MNMENEIILAGCPICGMVHKVMNTPGIEGKSLTCKKCGTKQPFSKYRIIVQEESGTTTSDSNVRTKVGKLYWPDKDLSFDLKPGRNVIGRQANSSKADIQLPCRSRLSSREHIVIEVKGSISTGYSHQISLYKENVNRVLVGGNALSWGDVLVLNDGDTIVLPDEPIGVRLCFVMSEEMGQ